jgi:hypothetical protein
MSFILWLENRESLILRGLAAEARKAPTFEDFEHDFSHEIKHGLYWHWTDDPNFQIDPLKGPKDMSSMAHGGIDVGKLMITSHLKNWDSYGDGGKGRKYVAIIDMSEVPRKAYYQVNRGFGNEFFVSDPSQAKVIKVVTRQQALRIDREQDAKLPSSIEALKNFYNSVH